MKFQLLRACGSRSQEEAAVVCFISDSVSLHTTAAVELADRLSASIERMEQPRLILDFENVDFVSSSALGTLVSLHERLVAKGKCLTIDNLCPNVYEVFTVTRLDRLLHLQPAGPQRRSPNQVNEDCYLTGVLVADDEPLVLSVLETVISRAGFRVWLAVHGYQAIDLYKRHQDGIAAVLLDVRMPGLDGPRTLLELRRQCPRVRCCFMTGNPLPYTIEGLLQMGVARVFRKPIASTDIIDTLRQMLGKSL